MELRVSQGTMLAAWPDLMDANFMHTVLLMCQHSDEGAYGLVVNRRTSFRASDLFKDHPTLGGLDFPIHQGGPVDHTALQFVHTVPHAVPDGTALCDGLWIGGDIDALGEFIAQNRGDAERKVRLFLGYSGWGKGQLESELAAKSWVPGVS